MNFLANFFLDLAKNRNSTPDFWRGFCAVHLRVISKKHFFFGVPPHTLDSVAQHTHAQKFLLGRLFRPSPYLHFGSGLRSIPRLYAELRLFEKQATFSVLVMGKTH